MKWVYDGHGHFLLKEVDQGGPDQPLWGMDFFTRFPTWGGYWNKHRFTLLIRRILIIVD